MTVNVNFPEAAVQQATDDYVQDLYKSREKGRGTAAPTSPSTPANPLNVPAAMPSRHPDKATSSGNWGLFTEAFADELSSGDLKIRVGSAKSLTIKDRQIARLDKIREALASGSIGESNLGMLQLDPGGKLPEPAKAAIQPLVEAENRDRSELYAEILASNGYPKSRIIDLQKSFARSFQSHAAPGTWVQDSRDAWSKKP